MDHTITLEALAQSNKALGISIDTVWVLLAAALVFLMQAGQTLW